MKRSRQLRRGEVVLVGLFLVGLVGAVWYMGRGRTPGEVVPRPDAEPRHTAHVSSPEAMRPAPSEWPTVEPWQLEGGTLSTFDLMPQRDTAFALAATDTHLYVFRSSGLDVYRREGNELMPVGLPPFTDSLIPSDQQWGHAVIEGDVAYVLGPTGLGVLDLGQPDSPGLQSAGNALAYNDIAIAHGHAFVTSFWGGLQVLSLEDPSWPSSVAEALTDSHARGVAVADDLAYVLTLNQESSGADFRPAQLRILDVSQPREPTEIAALDLPEPWRIRDDSKPRYFDGYIYVTGYGPIVVDVHDPTSPQVVSTVEDTYVADLIRLGDHIVGTYPWPQGEEPGMGLFVFDASDISHPKTVHSFGVPGGAYDALLLGDRLAVAAADGLHVFEIADLTQPREVVTPADDPYWLADVVVQGDQAFLADEYHGLVVVDVSDRAAPRVLGEAGFRGQGVAVTGEVAYLLDDMSLWTLEVSDPSRPSIIGDSLELKLENPLDYPYTRDLVIVGDRAYLAAASGGGVRVLDLNDPLRPAEVGSAPFDQASGIAVDGSHAYVNSERGGFRVADISRPEKIEVVGSIEEAFARQVAEAGGYAYFADYVTGLNVVDVRDPAEPRVVATMPFSHTVADSLVLDGYLYLATEAGGVRVVDVRDPLKPREVAALDDPPYSSSLFAADGFMYVARGFGLEILDVHDPAAPIAVGALILSTPAASR